MQVYAEHKTSKTVDSSLKNLMNLWGDPELHLDEVFNTVTGKVEKCYQACELQTLAVLSSTSSYPSRNVFPSVPAFCVVFVKIRDRVCKVRKQNDKKKVSSKDTCFRLQLKGGCLKQLKQ